MPYKDPKKQKESQNKWNREYKRKMRENPEYRAKELEKLREYKRLKRAKDHGFETYEEYKNAPKQPNKKPVFKLSATERKEKAQLAYAQRRGYSSFEEYRKDHPRYGKLTTAQRQEFYRRKQMKKFGCDTWEQYQAMLAEKAKKKADEREALKAERLAKKREYAREYERRKAELARAPRKPWEICGITEEDYNHWWKSLKRRANK